MFAFRSWLIAAALALVGGVTQAQNQALSVSTNLNPASGYLDVPHSPLLAPPSITIEAWVKYDDATIPTGWVFPTIGRKNFVQGVAEWFLRVDAGNNNTKRLRLWVNGTNGICNVNWNFTAGQLATWTHVAATYDGSFGRIYINGAQVAQTVGTGPLVGLGDIMRIGAGDTAPGSANERWNGLLDEVRIWSVARTQQEIAAGMNQQILQAPGLSASYLMNGDGQDQSGNGLHATLVANPTFVNVQSPIGPVVYCTAGTTTNGCVASIAASANPQVSSSTGCTITVSNAEGLKTGIIFYGLDSLPQAWCASGGSSFLCVKAPTQRTFVQSTGGTVNTCNGSLVLDWGAFQSTNLGGLGQPFSAGDSVYVQAWFRDPPACKTTSLSNAVEMTYAP
jgi:hypothetical protein